MKFFKHFFALALLTTTFINACEDIPVMVQAGPKTELTGEILSFDNSEIPETIMDRNDKPVNLDKKKIDWVKTNVAGLTPVYPILAYNNSSPSTIGELDKSYIIKKSGKFYNINTKQDLRYFFAPVDSEVEALRFALIITGSKAVYDINKYKSRNVSSKFFDRTHVEKVSDGYNVYLFDYNESLCQYTPVYSVVYQVSGEGYVRKLTDNYLFDTNFGCNL
jgi:hypothetical protein